MIANALYLGKRILFVAEKKVALMWFTAVSPTLVSSPIACGLNPTANKRQVYDELAERIDLATPSRPKRDGVHEVSVNSKMN